MDKKIEYNKEKLSALRELGEKIFINDKFLLPEELESITNRIDVLAKEFGICKCHEDGRCSTPEHTVFVSTIINAIQGEISFELMFNNHTQYSKEDIA